MPPPIPATYDELVDHYDPWVRSVIATTARLSRQQRALTDDEADDIRQHVYMVMLRRDYLARCRAYIATHHTSITSSLQIFVQRVTMNYFRDQHVRSGYERRATRDVKIVRKGSDALAPADIEYDIRDPRDVPRQIEAGIMLDELGAQLPPATREVFEVCRREGEISGRVIADRLPSRHPRAALRTLRRDLKETYAAAGL